MSPFLQTLIANSPVIAYGVMYGALAFAMAAVEPMGEIAYGDLESNV